MLPESTTVSVRTLLLLFLTVRTSAQSDQGQSGRYIAVVDKEKVSPVYSKSSPPADSLFLMLRHSHRKT